MLNFTNSTTAQSRLTEAVPLISIQLVHVLNGILASMLMPRAMLYFENSTKPIVNEVLSSTKSFSPHMLWLTSNINTKYRTRMMLINLTPLDIVIVLYDDVNKLVAKHESKEIHFWEFDSSCYLILHIAKIPLVTIDFQYFRQLQHDLKMYCVAIIQQFGNELQINFLRNDDSVGSSSDLDENYSWYDRLFGWQLKYFNGNKMEFIHEINAPYVVKGRTKRSSHSEGYEYGAGGSLVYLIKQIERYLNVSIYVHYETRATILGYERLYRDYVINEVENIRDVDEIIPSLLEGLSFFFINSFKYTKLISFISFFLVMIEVGIE